QSLRPASALLANSPIIWEPLYQDCHEHRTTSMPAFGLGCCDRCHRLLFEWPIIFWMADLRRELVMLSALAALGCGLAAAQGDLPGQPPGRSWPSGRLLLVSLVQMPA